MYVVLFYGLYPKAKNINQHVLVTHVTHYETYDRYTVFTGIYKYHLSSRNKYVVGDILNLSGEIESYRRQTIPGGFNSFEYWLGKDIKGIIRLDNVNLTHKSMLRQIKLKEVIFFDLFKDESLIETEWMSHLFKLSSIHLTFLIALFMKLLYYLDIENRGKYLIVSIIMFIMYFIGYSVIILRMFIKYALQYINLKTNLGIDNFNLECITLALIILLQPFIIYNQSFLVIYVLIFFMKLKTDTSSLLTWLSIPMLISPFLLHWHKNLSLLSLLVIPIFGVILRYVWVPSLLVASILPFISILGFISNTMMHLEDFLRVYEFKLYFIHLTGITWIIYFLVVAYVFAAPHKKAFFKRLSIYLTVCVVSFLYTFKPLEDSVIFLDVGQGDSAVIFKDNKVIVVDAFNSVSTYLKYNYVYEIDYLIITHSDLDHMKEVEDLLKHFIIKNIILSKHNDYGFVHPNIFYVGEDNINFDNEVDIKILGPFIDFKNTNENSVMFKIEVGSYTYLFTGDIGIAAEKLYIETYGAELKSDVLKVPHHGSNTSSSILFLNYVQPSIALVSVGNRNTYNLPNDEIIEIYKNLGVYIHQTKDLGSLKIQNRKMRNFPP